MRGTERQARWQGMLGGVCAGLTAVAAAGCVDNVNRPLTYDVACDSACVAAATRVRSCAGGTTAAALDSLSPWPFLPAGFSIISDEPFNALTENGWITLQRDTSHGSGASLDTEVTRAPLSPPSVVKFTYAKGFQGGHTPAVTFYDLAVPVREAYFGFWWLASNPWQNNIESGINKLAFQLTTQTAVNGEAAMVMFGTDSGPYTVQVVTEFPGDIRRLPPNLAPTLVTLGQWHRVEWYTKFSSTDSTRDGIVRWWLDGVPQGEYTDVVMPIDPGLKEFQIAPTWGGVVGTKTERDFFCYDHAVIAAPAVPPSP